MPSTHLALNYHLIFSTKNRETWMAPAWRDQLHAYMGGAINGMKSPSTVGGVSDHVQLLVGLRATHRLADVMRELKSESSRWVHDTMRLPGFAWQEGYAGISVSPSHLEDVRRYVLTQDEHHRTKTFQEEYLEFLQKCGIEYDDAYLW
jgi:REP element-mobilizing transposase RayT